jgi:hypothetical protein
MGPHGPADNDELAARRCEQGKRFSAIMSDCCRTEAKPNKE